MNVPGLIGAGAQAVGAIGSIIGGRKDAKAAQNSALQSWQRNYEAQKEFAQNSIQWRVQDAKNAGINPYAVIGGQTSGYTPQDTSYQTHYQQGVSHAMNGISDAMGQLNMAMASEDLKGKRLENESKAIELVNKAIEAQLGMTSATLQQPWFKTFTPPVKGTDEHKIRTGADGRQVATSNADDGGFDNPQGMRDQMDALFNLPLFDALKLANGGKGAIELGFFGNRYVPHGVEPNRANVWAADIQREYGDLAGWLSLPFAHAYDKWESARRSGAGKKAHKNNIKALKSWLGR